MANLDLFEYVKSITGEAVKTMKKDDVIVMIKRVLLTDKSQEALALCVLFQCTIEDLARSYYDKMKVGDKCQ